MNKSIKKIITLFTVMAISLTVVGCSKGNSSQDENSSKKDAVEKKEAMTPEQVLDEYFKDIKKAENLKSSKDINSLLAKTFNNANDTNYIEEMGKENTDKFIKDFMIPISNSIEYKIGEVVVDDNKATAKVTITAIDVSEKTEDIFGGILRESMKLALDGKEPTDEEMIGILIDELINASKGENAQKSTSDIEMTLEKKENEWIVNENTQLKNILGGNISKIGDRLKSLDLETPSN
ncbi:MAG: hypothetical protein KID00_14550 [Clostridium argentinense]|uniref:Lipoprotein n=1 Tax=Clostridium faecium TaxID=2762223 RepID=A0ABR8YQI7_9CLOT|nr:MULTISPECIES: hypothetical protein [Clostridium]MBD8046532.1 hypothetical protein [Clostridium faecium]MBS5825043.1 hypothetical protein [Clostridium argentinense]MDU1349154.1 hypothetical protein [Clostridium argentinense]